MIPDIPRLAAPLLLSVAVVPAWAANDPVKEIASERFALTENGHRITMPYEATHPLHEVHPEVTRLTFMVHGILRNTDVYHALVMDAHRRAGSPEHVAIISPQFLTAEDVRAFELDDDFAYWTRGGWAAGHRSRSNDDLARPVRISSYAMLDSMLQRALHSYPSLEELVIAGHSAGGQFVNRYAASNRVHDALERRGIEVTYVIANPSSYLYFCHHRPISHDPVAFAPIDETDYADCEQYDRYRYGLSNLNAYMREAGPEKLAERYASRRVIYFLGGDDNDPDGRYLARGCAAMAQGAQRLERGVAYYHYVAFLNGEDAHERHSKVIVPGVAHSARGMYTSAQGVEILFGPDETAGKPAR